MATFYLQDRDAEGLAGPGAFSKGLSSGLGNPGSITFTVPNSSTSSCLGITNRNSPSNADFEDGNITVKVNVTTASADILLSVQAVRFNAAGSAQENTGTTAEQTLSATGVYTFTLSSTTWTAGSCDDRFAIWYYFRSTNSQGGDVGVTIETGTTDCEVTHSGLTRSAGTCYAVFNKDLRQFRNDRTTAIAEGGFSLGDGVSNNVYLDFYTGAYEWFDNDEVLTAKVEAEAVGTAFNDVVNHTAGRGIRLNPSTPHIRRSHSCCFDSTRNRLLMCGGIDDTGTQYNDLWELSLDPDSKPQWKQLSPTGTPMSARRTHIMEYDATNDRAIIGYGYDGADKGDIFEIQFTTESSPGSFDTDSPNGKWAALSPSGTAPEARAQLSSTIDNTNGKMYIIHGWGASRYNDVHELDLSPRGGAWTELNDGTGTAPEVRNDPAVALDEINNRIVIFGGYDGTTYYNDTWELDLTTNNYTELTPTGTPPSGRELAISIEDPVNHRMLLKGGRNGTAQSNIFTDFWELDMTDGSEAWTDLTKADGTRNLGLWTNGSGVYDPNHDAFIMFGGMDESNYETRQVFAYDVSTDGEAIPYGLHQNNGMRGRDAMAYAYNPDRRETLMVGGYRDPAEGDLFNGDHTSEMWIFDHANDIWYQPLRDSIFTIPPREGVSACYDTSRNRYLIFGGFTGNDTANNYHYNDVWELKVDTKGIYRLKLLTPTGTKPAARWLQATIYDITNDRMIMFGGDASGTYQNDVWELDFAGGENGAWSELSPTGTAPSSVRQCAYSYDATNGRMIIMGGGTGVNSFVNNVHALDLTNGSEAWSSLSTGPSARRGMTMCYAADKEYMLCFGGYDGTNVLGDTWKLDLSTDTWTEFSPATSPLARRSHVAGYDQTSETMMIYGGRDTANDGLSFVNRNNNYFFDTTNATESNWDWSFKPLYPYLQNAVEVTGLTASENYHWQALTTGDVQNDSDWVSAFSNTEASVDFSTGTGETTSSITKSLQYNVLATLNYSREGASSLPTDNSALSTIYSAQDFTDVETSNDVYVGLTTSLLYALHLFKVVHTNNTDPFTVNWEGRSDLAPSTSTVYLQIYNQTTTSWETIDSDSTTAANTDFILTSTISTSLSDYYNVNNQVSCRVYQSKT